MDPHQLIGLVGPANNFAMGGLPMNLTRVLLMEGKSLPKELFLEIVIEKTQILVNHGCGCFSFCFQYCWKVIFSRTEQ